MKTDRGQEFYGIGLDTSQLEEGRLQAISLFNDIAKEAESSGDSMDRAMDKAIGNVRKNLDEIDTKSFSERLQSEIDKNIEAFNKIQVEITELKKTMSEVSHPALLEEYEKKLLNLDNRAGILSSTISHLKSMQSQYNKEVEEATDKGADFGKIIENITKEANPLNEVMGKLPKPLQSVIRGLQGMTGAAKKFVAVPLIAVITAIVVGLTTLFSWFNKTAEGQMAFAKITGYVSGVVNQLKEIVITVGKAIYDAFTNPQEAVKKLWNTIKENLINRVVGLGDMFKALGRIISSGFTDGFDDLNNAFFKVTTGVDNLLEKTSDYVKGIHEAAKKTQELKLAEEQLHRDRSNWSVREAELDSKIAEARNRMYQGTDKQRMDAAKEVEGYIAEKYEQKIKFAKEELRIRQELNSLTSSAQSDLDKENELKAELLNLEKQRNTELRSTSRISGSIESKDTAEAERIAEAHKRALESYRKAVSQIEEQIEQDRFELKKASIKDRSELIEAEYNYELSLIERNRQAFIEEHEGVDVDTSVFDKLIELSKERREAADREYFDEVLKGYQTLEERRNEIVKKFAKERALLESGNIDGSLDENIEELNKREREALARFDTQSQEKTSIMVRMFSDMSDKSIEELKKIRDEAEALWAFLSSGVWDEKKGAAFGITLEQFDDLISNPDQLVKFKKGVDNIRESIYKLDKPINQIKEGFKELFDPDLAGTNKQLEAIRKIQQGYEKYADAVGLVSDAVGALGELSDSDLLKGISDGLSDVLQVGDDVMKGAQVGSQFGAIGAVAGGVIGAVKGISTVLSRNKKHREELQKQIEENQRIEYFGQLEIEALYRQKYEWTKRIGEATLHYIKREGEELKKQSEANAKVQSDLWNKLIDTQYKSGEHFKKTGLFGLGKGKIVEEWTSLAGKSWEQIEALATQGKLSEDGMRFYEALRKAKEEGQDLQKMQIEYLEKLRETYTGTTYEAMVSSIVNAFSQGKRSAYDFANSFEELMQGAIESSLALLADEQFREWYEDFAEAGKDGYTQDEIEQAKRDWIRLNENLAEQAKQLEEVTGRRIGTIEQQGASVGVYDKVTQDQWSQTDGLLRGMYMVVVDNSNELKSISGWGEHIQEMRNIALESWGELISIRKNTKLIEETNNKLDKVIKNTENL